MENELPLALGILGLHCCIKCLEFILHLSCKMEIKNELDLYCTETAKFTLSLYDWYVMPSYCTQTATA